MYQKYTGTKQLPCLPCNHCTLYSTLLACKTIPPDLQCLGPIYWCKKCHEIYVWIQYSCKNSNLQKILQLHLSLSMRGWKKHSTHAKECRSEHYFWTKWANHQVQVNVYLRENCGREYLWTVTTQPIIHIVKWILWLNKHKPSSMRIPHHQL